MANYTTLSSLFTATANAIRSKTGDTAKLVADNFPTAISSIQVGVDTSDATATAEDIALNKTAWARGAKLVGTSTAVVLPKVVVDGANYKELMGGTNYSFSAQQMLEPAPGRVCAICYDEIYFSGDYGVTWATAQTGYIFGTGFLVSNGRLLVSADKQNTSDPAGSLLYSNNSGYTWTDATVSKPGWGNHVFNSFIELKNGRVLCCMKYNTTSNASDTAAYIMYSDNQGIDWSYGKALCATCFCQMSSGRVIAVTDTTPATPSGGIWYSDDSGSTWTQTNITITTQFSNVKQFKTGRVFAVGGINNYYSDTGGATWQTGTQTGFNFGTLVELKSGRIVTGGYKAYNKASGYYYSDDQGITWLGSNVSDYYRSITLLSNGRLIMTSIGTDTNGTITAWCSDDGKTYTALPTMNGTTIVPSGVSELSSGRVLATIGRVVMSEPVSATESSKVLGSMVKKGYVVYDYLGNAYVGTAE